VSAGPVTMRRAAFASVALGLALPTAVAGLAGTACTLTLPGSSDAGDAGTVVEAGVGTVGQVCTQILTELCTQSIDRCGLMGFTIQDCVTNDMSQCCSTSCSEESDASSGTVSGCKSAFDSEDCNAITNNTTPSACTTLLGM
jgi:hypothetical protein